MQVHCPECHRLLVAADLNVAKDVACCPTCSEVFALSSLLSEDELAQVDIDEPPRGAWYRDDFDEWLVGATTRHPIAFFLVPFMCVWSGGSLGGIYGRQIINGEFELGTSLFGIPFLLGTFLFGSLALMSMCGKVVARIRGDAGMIFTGVGPFGWRRRFSLATITDVRIEPYQWNNGNPTKIILFDGPQKLRFATMLSETRREYMAAVLRKKSGECGQPGGLKRVGV